MGRPAEGYTVTWKRAWAYVRFTWEGEPYYIALGTKDRREAEAAAAREYADIVRGKRRAIKAHPGRGLDLPILFAEWIESKRPSIDPRSVPMLEMYAKGFVSYFESLDRTDEASASSYGLQRLGQALRTTVVRELAYLRQFLKWCKLHGALHYPPEVPALPPKALGTRTGTHRAKSVMVTPAEAAAIIAQLPKESKSIDGKKWPLRDRFAFMWETALRPETLNRLSVPVNWRPGMKHLELSNEDDKARFGRDVDLTKEAIAILLRVAPKEGLIFGAHVYTKHLKRAAKAILGERRGKSFAPYDFRHGRAKERLDAGASLRGVAYMLGHKRMSTTDKYLAPDRAAGRDALEK